MTVTGDRLDLEAALPQLDGTLVAAGLDASLTMHRDAHGVPHVRAATEHDAWFGMGYASAQDRLWQMEWYRRRGTGRWAEAAGPSGVEADRLFRRFQLDAASRADVEAMTSDTRAMFQAYADGVNAFITSGQPLPVEYALTGLPIEPWEPWQSVLIFKVRHAIMGKRPIKLARSQLLQRIGIERYALLEGIEPAGLAMILPPGGVNADVIAQAETELARAADDLGTLALDEGGSNSWAVHGSRTTTGMPLLANDSHRPLDVPNVYWQMHVTCPEFNVAGGAFPGVPGFAHFGHNGQVAWNITHGQADYQDLYIEQFDPDDPTRYRTEDGWADADVRHEEIKVRGEAPVPVEVVRTRNGHIVHGAPSSGTALALRYTATDRPCRQWECLRPMLRAGSVEELHETQRGWAEPVNALLSADTAGSIGFLYRGRVPVRSTEAARQFAVPGWTGEHRWTGDVPFEALPQAVNPPEGFFATANQRTHEGDDPYLAYEFTVPARAERLAEVLTSRARSTPEEVSTLQGDMVSLPARRWTRFLGAQPALEGDAERARSMLAGWDGDLRPESPEALLYAHFRTGIARAVFEPIVGEDTWRWLTTSANTGTATLLARWSYHTSATLEGSTGTPDGRPWSEVLPGALEAAWRDTARDAGTDDPSGWRWDSMHRTNAAHTLSGAFPQHAEALNPPSIGMGGDPDTVQVSGYAWNPKGRFAVSSVSVYRQFVDFAAPESATWSLPGGESGLPGTEHASDQLELWARHERIPMHLRPEDAEAAAVHTLTLVPG
ncbi:MAG: hypothetical protein GEU80_13100 [Dehalococcoidia bacterium]|nr:hypothetical protein [Dehalococcoidia bacterium]